MFIFAFFYGINPIDNLLPAKCGVVYGGRAAEIEFCGAPILDGGKSFLSMIEWTGENERKGSLL